jgi:hypothetical protein
LAFSGTVPVIRSNEEFLSAGKQIARRELLNDIAYRRVVAGLLNHTLGAIRDTEQWVALLTRVHGGLGAFLPVGIRIGEDAMKRLNAKPRELDVTFYQGEGTVWPKIEAVEAIVPGVASSGAVPQSMPMHRGQLHLQKQA